MLIQRLTMCLLAILMPAAFSQQSAKLMYQNESASVPERVQDLLSRMTLEEKVAQLQSSVNQPALGSTSSSFFSKDEINEVVVKKALGNGLGTYAFLDEFLGMSKGPREEVLKRNLLQTWVIKNTRLGIPILFHGEALHGSAVVGATAFPQAVALGSTWDPNLLKEVFRTVALEARASGNALVLAPVLDLSRDPRYGRVEEMYSEDPYLVAQMGIAAVRGLQGDGNLIDQDHVLATAKHFVHGQPENGTNVGPNDFSERTMRSVFFYPFQQVIEKAHIEAVMPSYNENDGGLPSHGNPWLLKDVLRHEWGFSGLTISDYYAVQQLSTLHHVVADDAAAGVLAFNSGVDMELPSAIGFPSLVAAAKAGTVSVKGPRPGSSPCVDSQVQSRNLRTSLYRSRSRDGGCRQ